MNTIKASTAELLYVLEANKSRHRATFEKALEGWRKKVVEELDRACDDAKAGRRFRTSFDLPQPQDYTEKYEEVIGMLKMHVDDTIELEQGEFRQYVQDNWNWQHHFAASTAQYLGN